MITMRLIYSLNLGKRDFEELDAEQAERKLQNDKKKQLNIEIKQKIIEEIKIKCQQIKNSRKYLIEKYTFKCLREQNFINLELLKESNLYLMWVNLKNSKLYRKRRNIFDCGSCRNERYNTGAFFHMPCSDYLPAIKKEKKFRQIMKFIQRIESSKIFEPLIQNLFKKSMKTLAIERNTFDSISLLIIGEQNKTSSCLMFFLGLMQQRSKMKLDYNLFLRSCLMVFDNYIPRTKYNKDQNILNAFYFISIYTKPLFSFFDFFFYEKSNLNIKEKLTDPTLQQNCLFKLHRKNTEIEDKSELQSRSIIINSWFQYNNIAFQIHMRIKIDHIKNKGLIYIEIRQKEEENIFINKLEKNINWMPNLDTRKRNPSKENFNTQNFYGRKKTILKGAQEDNAFFLIKLQTYNNKAFLDIKLFEQVGILDPRFNYTYANSLSTLCLLY